MLYKIYYLADETGSMRYIGYTSLSEARRMAEHRHSHPNRRGYTFHLLDVFDNKKDALEAERQYIAAFRPPENIAPGQGWPDSLEVGRQTVAAMRRRAVRCIDTGETYPSVSEAARLTGIDRQRIKDCCHHRRQSTQGMHFCFVEEIEERLKDDTGSSHANTEVITGTKKSVTP